MSVLVNMRTESKVEFIKVANELAMESIDLVSRLSARYGRIFTEKVSEIALDLVVQTTKANTIRATDKQKFALRAECLYKARQDLDALEVLLIMVYEILQKNPKAAFNKRKPDTTNYDSEWAIKKLNQIVGSIGLKIDKEEALLKGVLESDKKSFQKNHSEEI